MRMKLTTTVMKKTTSTNGIPAIRKVGIVPITIEIPYIVLNGILIFLKNARPTKNVTIPKNIHTE